MTQIITRLFASEKSAAAVVRKLNDEGFPKYILRIFKGTGTDNADAMAARLEKADIDPAAAAAYAKHLKGDAALLLIPATYKPLGAARIAREILADADTVDVGDIPDDTYVPDRPDHAPSILKGHPLLITLPLWDEEMPRGTVTDGFMRLLSPHRTKRSAMSGDHRMSRFFWPMPLLKRHRTANSAIHGGKYMSQIFWPQRLLSTGPRRSSVIPGGGRPLSRLFGWPTIIHRK